MLVAVSGGGGVEAASRGVAGPRWITVSEGGVKPLLPTPAGFFLLSGDDDDDEAELLLSSDAVLRCWRCNFRFTFFGAVVR